jgi:hypothetical protein
MTRRDGDGTCKTCNQTFGYMLIHNGFSDSAYAYCDLCGKTALFSAWSPTAPKGIDVGFHGPLRQAVEARVQPCSCGGAFRGSAPPRCPRCGERLSAEQAAEYLERNAPGTAKGWRWQRTWGGLYAIIIEDRVVNDPWIKDAG